MDYDSFGTGQRVNELLFAKKNTQKAREGQDSSAQVGKGKLEDAPKVSMALKFCLLGECSHGPYYVLSKRIFCLGRPGGEWLLPE